MPTKKSKYEPTAYSPQWTPWMAKRAEGMGIYYYPEQVVRFEGKRIKVQVAVTCMGGLQARIENPRGTRWVEIYKNAHEPRKPTYGLRFHRMHESIRLKRRP